MRGSAPTARSLSFPRAWQLQVLVISERPACQVWLPQHSKGGACVSMGSTASEGRERGPGGAPAFHPCSDPPSACSALDCEPLGCPQPQEGNSVCGVSTVPDSIINITCKLSKAPVPCFGHQDSSTTVLVKPTSLTGTKNIASQAGLGSTDLQQATSSQRQRPHQQNGHVTSMDPQRGQLR